MSPRGRFQRTSLKENIERLQEIASRYHKTTSAPTSKLTKKSNNFSHLHVVPTADSRHHHEMTSRTFDQRQQLRANLIQIDFGDGF